MKYLVFFLYFLWFSTVQAAPYPVTCPNDGGHAEVFPSGEWVCGVVSGGGSSPGGSTNSIQYNAGSSTLGGISVADGNILIGQTGTFPAAKALSGDCTLADTGAITCTKINGEAVTLGGTFTMLGAFNFTGTLTNTTNVTFPTSGTLATTTQLGSINLGTSASAVNPQRSGDTSTGFYTSAASTVNVAGNGVQIMQWDTLSSGVDYLTVTAGKSGTAPAIADAGSTSTQSINIVPKGYAGEIQYNGTNAIWEDNTNFNTAGGDTNLPNTNTASGSPNGQNNTAFGYEALNANTTGHTNTAFGTQALQVATTAISNSAFGYQALVAATTGSNNAAFGTTALGSVTTGSFNTCIGNDACGNLQGSNNTVLGYLGLGGNPSGITGSSNTIVGYNSAQSDSWNANQNTTLGANTLEVNTTGASNLAAGYNSMVANTTGQGNTALGYGTLSVNTTGQTNTIVGTNVASTTLNGGSSNILIGVASATDTYSATSSNGVGINPGSTTMKIGSGDIGIGLGVLQRNAGDSQNNVAIGTGALGYNTTGINNVAIGNLAGDFSNITTQSQAVMIGYKASTGPNSVIIGAVAGDFASNDAGVGEGTLGNDTGGDNTALGYQALAANTTGTGNTAVGYNAATGTLTTGTNNTYYGESTVASGAAVTNENVFGGGITGLGSNSLTLGGIFTATSIGTVTSATSNVLGGTVNIGSPTGTGGVTVTSNATTAFSIAQNASTIFTTNTTGASFQWTPKTSGTASTVRFKYTPAADTALTTAVAAPIINFGGASAVKRTHANGAISAVQEDFVIQGTTDAFTSSASTLTGGAVLTLLMKDASTNATVTTEYGLYIPTYAFTGTVTNGYSIYIAAPTGAGTGNYALGTSGAVQMASLTTASGVEQGYMCVDSSGNVYNDSVPCVAPVPGTGLAVSGTTLSLATSGTSTPLVGSGGTPTCGTGCSSITSSPQSTDERGSATSGTLATSVVVNFSTTLAAAPFCVCQGSATTATVGCTSSTSALTASLSTGVTGDVITWICAK